jgi:hypothetical protein
MLDVDKLSRHYSVAGTFNILETLYIPRLYKTACVSLMCSVAKHYKWGTAAWLSNCTIWVTGGGGVQYANICDMRNCWA